MKSRNFCQRLKFCEKSKFWSKVEIFVKSRNFSQKSKFLSKVEIFIKSRTVCQKSNFLSKVEFFVKSRNRQSRSSEIEIKVFPFSGFYYHIQIQECGSFVENEGLKKKLFFFVFKTLRYFFSFLINIFNLSLLVHGI